METTTPAPPAPAPSRPATPAPARPATPAPSRAANPRPAPQHMGFDLTRPFRYTFSLIKGTLRGGLDGLAKFGRKGFFAAAGLAILFGIATATFSLGAVLMYGVIGLAAAGVAGAGLGAVWGGYQGLARSYRRDKYANELAERQTGRASRPAQGRSPSAIGLDYRSDYAARESRASYNFERSLQQDRENDRDYMTYWQDRVNNGHNHSNGRGF